MALLIDAYEDVFKTSVIKILGTSLRDVLRTLVGHVRWSYILDHVGGVFITSAGDVLKTSVGNVSWRYM